MKLKKLLKTIGFGLLFSFGIQTAHLAAASDQMDDADSDWLNENDTSDSFDASSKDSENDELMPTPTELIEEGEEEVLTPPEALVDDSDDDESSKETMADALDEDNMPE